VWRKGDPFGVDLTVESGGVGGNARCDRGSASTTLPTLGWITTNEANRGARRGGLVASGSQGRWQVRAWCPSLWHHKQRGTFGHLVVTWSDRRQLKQRPTRSGGTRQQSGSGGGGRMAWRQLLRVETTCHPSCAASHVKPGT
jgi:hypothetical protein